MKGKYGLFVCIILVVSCVEVTEPECLLEYDEEVSILESSVESLSFLQNDRILKYLNNNADTVEYNTSYEENGIWCLHSWVCPDDGNVTDHFLAKRNYQTLNLTSDHSSMKLGLSLTTSLNDDYPLKYADVLSISVEDDQEHQCRVSTLVVDPRSDASANNAHLEFFDSLEIVGSLYENVYRESNMGYEVFYNLSYGIIKLIHSESGVSLTLIGN